MLVGAFGSLRIAQIPMDQLKKFKQQNLQSGIRLKKSRVLKMDNLQLEYKAPDFSSLDYDQCLLNLSYTDLGHLIPPVKLDLEEMLSNCEAMKDQYAVVVAPAPKSMRIKIPEAEIQLVESSIYSPVLAAQQHKVKFEQVQQVRQDNIDDIPQQQMSDSELVSHVQLLDSGCISEQIRQVIEAYGSRDPIEILENYKNLYQ